MANQSRQPESESWLLSEREKELNCLYGMSRLFERGEEHLEDTLRAVVELLPAAWQHVDVAGARIQLHGIAYSTGGFRESPWQQSCPVVVLGEEAGWVTVSYAEEQPESDEGPFLAEERSLINAVAQRLGAWVEKERAREQLLEYQQNLRSLAAQLTVTEQQERRRIAELLHDRIGQALALLSIKLAQVRSSTDDVGLRNLLSEVQGLAQDVIAETRSLTFDLCPPILYELGLSQAVDWLTEQYSDTYGLDVGMTQTGDLGGLSEELRTTVFQAVRELLTNVVKHADARRVRVSLIGSTGSVVVAVEDDGVGLEAARIGKSLTPDGGFGLFSIRERLSYLGGGISVESPAGGGTTVRLEVPRDI